MIGNEKTCCFTGHRPEKLSYPEEVVKYLLEKEIIKAADEGFTTFITGMSRGTDIWAAEAVVELKNQFFGVRLICAVPYLGFGKRCGDFEKILSLANEAEYICGKYQRNCFQKRNEWMVDRSERVIAVFNGERGGTYNTLRYAKKHGVEVINVLDGLSNEKSIQDDFTLKRYNL